MALNNREKIAAAPLTIVQVFADNQSGPYFFKSCFTVIRLQVKE